MDDTAMPLLFALDDVVNKYNTLLKELNREDEIQSVTKYFIPYVAGDKQPDIKRATALKKELTTELLNVLMDSIKNDQSGDF